MRRFKNILFVNEPGTQETATPRAVVELARTNGARLTVVDVAYDLARSFSNLQRALDDLRNDNLRRLFTGVDTSDVDIRFDLLNGAPFIEVIRQVERAGHDLVIKNSEPGGLSDKQFGANDMHLMRKCPCPLWIARSDQFGTYRSIIAAIDVDPDVPTNDELNALILDLSISLAKQSGCALHVAHACWVHNETVLKGLQNGAGAALEALEEDRRARVLDLVAERELDGLDVGVHLGRARPAEYVTSLARREGADLVVMGTVARTGVPGYFIGNTAERILANLECSALTVKPRAFISPVT